MELTKDLSRENMPTPIIRKSRTVTSPEMSLDLTDDDNRINTRKMSAEEISERLEAILLERIKDGDDEALFQLGQVLFEQVISHYNIYYLNVIFFNYFHIFKELLFC